MKQDLYNTIKKLAESKKNGIYTKQGIKYAVKNGMVVLWAEGHDVHQVASGFNVFIGKVENRWEVAEKLKELYKKLN